MSLVASAGFTDMPMTVVVNGQRPGGLDWSDGWLSGKSGGWWCRVWRYFDAGDMDAPSKVCFITQELAIRSFGVENPIGRALRMGEMTSQ